MAAFGMDESEDESMDVPSFTAASSVVGSQPPNDPAQEQGRQDQPPKQNVNQQPSPQKPQRGGNSVVPSTEPAQPPVQAPPLQPIPGSQVSQEDTVTIQEQRPAPRTVSNISEDTWIKQPTEAQVPRQRQVSPVSQKPNDPPPSTPMPAPASQTAKNEPQRAPAQLPSINQSVSQAPARQPMNQTPQQAPVMQPVAPPQQAPAEKKRVEFANTSHDGLLSDQAASKKPELMKKQSLEGSQLAEVTRPQLADVNRPNMKRTLLDPLKTALKPSIDDNKKTLEAFRVDRKKMKKPVVSAQEVTADGIETGGVIHYQPFKLDLDFRNASVTVGNITAMERAVEKVNGLQPFGCDDQMINLPFMSSQCAVGKIGPDGNATDEMNRTEFLMCIAMYNEDEEEVRNTFHGIFESLVTFQRAGIESNRISAIVIIDGFDAFFRTFESSSGLREYIKPMLDFQSLQNYWELGGDMTKSTLVKLKERVLHQLRFDIANDEFTSLGDIDNLRTAFKEQNTNEQNAGNAKEDQAAWENFVIQAFIKRFGETKLESAADDQQALHCWETKFTLPDFEGLELNVMFTIKQKNAKKLNTHLWFFGGFCQMINPRFVCLLDVGTKPMPNALYHMWEALKVDRRIAGCCGEIRPMGNKFLNFVATAQTMEYKFAHVFDKSLESVCGYITVLPGAFSCYSWQALQGVPLWTDYFKSIKKPEEMDAFNSNIYLAEDRVLCLSLVAKQDKDYLLRWVRSSIAETDIPEDFQKFLAQRRRWINGSWFALIDSVANFTKIGRTNHNFCRKLVFWFQLAYYIFNVVVSWFMVGCLFVVFALIIRMFIDDEANSDFSLSTFCTSFYVWMLLFTLIISLSVPPREVEHIYQGLMVLFGVYMILSLLVWVWLVLSGELDDTYALIGAAWAAGFFITAVVAHCAVLTALKSAFQFAFMTPTYINVLLMYSICNIHDVSWGNRPDTMSNLERARVSQFMAYRSRWVLIWVFSNTIFAYLFNSLDKLNSEENVYIQILAGVGLFMLALRWVGSILYTVQEACKSKYAVESG